MLTLQGVASLSQVTLKQEICHLTVSEGNITIY